MLKFELKFSQNTRLYLFLPFTRNTSLSLSLGIYFHLSYKSPFKKFSERREIKKCWIRDDITQIETFVAMLII